MAFHKALSTENLDLSKNIHPSSLRTHHWHLRRPGFTLIELLVAITILGILISVATFSINNALDKGRDNRRKQDLAQIKSALTLYFQDNGKYPPECTPSPCTEGATYASDNGADPWIPDLDSYIKKLPKDPRQVSLNIFSTLASLFGSRTTESVQPQVAGAIPPTFDAATSTQKNNPVTNLTWSHSTSGTDRLLVVGVSFRGIGAAAGIQNVTYNGITLTFVGGQTYVAGGNDIRWEIWKLKAPSAGGPYNIVVTPNSSDIDMVAGATSWSGVDQANPTGPYASALGESYTPSVNVSSAVGEVVIDVLAAEAASGYTATVGANQTQRWNRQTSGYNILGASSDEGGTTTVTMSWSLNNPVKWTIGAVPIIETRPLSLQPLQLQPQHQLHLQLLLHQRLRLHRQDLRVIVTKMFTVILCLQTGNHILSGQNWKIHLILKSTLCPLLLVLIPPHPQVSTTA